MTLYEIDDEATRHRIEAITAGGLRAMGELRQRAEDVDKSAEAMFERQEREKQAMDERVKLAEKDKPEPEPAKPKFPPKPATMSLGAEEFKQAREARKAEAADTPEQDKPARERPPKSTADDDMSGRTWLR